MHKSHYDYLHVHDKEYKAEIVEEIELGNIEVDELIRPLSDEINSFSDLVTINSCQGGGTTELWEHGITHTEDAYVSFIAVNGEEFTAKSLCSYLVVELGEEIIGADIEFEQPEGLDGIWPCCFLRYNLNFHHKRINQVTEAVKKFREEYAL